MPWGWDETREDGQVTGSGYSCAAADSHPEGLVIRPNLAALLLLLLAHPAAAQDATHRSETFVRGCNSPPLRDSGCKNFVVTEAAYFIRVPGKERESDRRPVGAAVDIGVMHNFGSRVALGVAGSAGLLSEGYIAVKPRARLWLSSTTSIDLAAGVVLHGEPPVTVEASIMFRDRIGFTLQGFSNPDFLFDNGQIVRRDRFDLFAGVRLGSKPGRIGILGDATAILVLFGAFILACRNGGCD